MAEQRTSENNVHKAVTTASAASVQKLLKTVSTPNTLNTTITRNGTPSPTLAQIGKQNSTNVRLSQLYDSGAESADADDHARLLPTTSSLRTHKFIIIPATPTTATTKTSTTATSPITGKTKFRQTVSTSALGALQNSAFKAPLSVVPPLTATAAPKAKSATVKPKNNFNKVITATTEDQTPPSDIVNQTNIVALSPLITTASTANSPIITARHSTAVTFTLDGCESDSATDFNSLSTTTADHTISAIHTPTTQYPAKYVLSNGTPTLDVNLRPHNERITSMRSVVSAYYQHEANQDTLCEQFLHTRPTSMVRELSTSSCIFRDQSVNQIYSDVTSVRSLASIGIGSTDGKKLVIKRVPQSPLELFNIVNPPLPLPPGMEDNDDESFLDMSDDSANLKPRQQHWGSKMQFVLACIGYSVGLGNVWRFPYMCYKSGGGVFLVPYCIILIVCSIPLLFMELSIGQYTGRGPIGALGQLCPLFKGAGVASVVVSFLMSTYYSVIIGYSIYYFFTAFKSEMPWVDCNNRWNTPDCWLPQRKDINMTAPAMSRTPSEEFFENKVLQISPGIEYPGQMRWELFACLICAWLMVYFATWKSIKSSAKVRYFTATFPFVLIIILMGRAVTLEGADKGLRYFFRPNWSELKNANVWINAASQNFNSLGITFGSMISFASYNKYNNNILRDTIAVGVVNILTSLLVGIFAFATLGNLALEQNTNVRDVIGDGPGLIFVVYPQAMAKMPYAQLWAVMFFFMLLCLGLNSQFAIVEVVVTSIQDGFPNWIKKHLGYHEILVLFVCIISFLFGLPNLIQGGIYFFQLMDHYAASVTIMFLAFCQMIAIAWLYGTGRLSKNIKQMTGKAPSLYFKSSWILLGPALLFAIWILSLINYEEPTYHNGHYKYPDWAYGIGWMFASFSLICIPGYAIINLIRASGSTFWERLRHTLNPNIYECRICGEHHCEHDYPEQEQYMLAQEMAGMYKPTTIPTQHMGLKTGYNPMYLQQEQQQNSQHNHKLHQQGQEDNQRHFEHIHQDEPPTTTTTATTSADS